MRKRVCVSLVALSFLVSLTAVAPASAKSVNAMRAQIPSDSHVGNTPKEIHAASGGMADAETVIVALH